MRNKPTRYSLDGKVCMHFNCGSRLQGCQPSRAYLSLNELYKGWQPLLQLKASKSCQIALVLQHAF